MASKERKTIVRCISRDSSTIKVPCTTMWPKMPNVWCGPCVRRTEASAQAKAIKVVSA